MTTHCPICGGLVQVMADNRIIKHFDIRNRPQWCKGSNTKVKPTAGHSDRQE